MAKTAGMRAKRSAAENCIMAVLGDLVGLNECWKNILGIDN